jgi:putative FmdB family regulatory protein
MANYLYKCKVCGEIFEKELHFDEEKREITCPKGRREVQRVYTPPQIFFKGPGFYINDSKSKSTIKD